MGHVTRDAQSNQLTLTLGNYTSLLVELHHTTVCMSLVSHSLTVTLISLVPKFIAPRATFNQ